MNENEIWKDISQNIKNIFTLGVRILFVKLFWVGVGATILFLLMIPAIKSGDLTIWTAILASIVGGLLGKFLSK